MDEIRGILELSKNDDKYWEVVDYYPNIDNPELILVDNKSWMVDTMRRQDKIMRRVSGIVIDMIKLRVHCKSYPSMEVISVYEKLSMDENVLNICTNVYTYLNNRYVGSEEIPNQKVSYRQVDMKRAVIYLGYEGKLLRIFKYNNKIFISTNQKLDVSKDQIYQNYIKLGGPNPTSLFEETDESYCYMFLVIHKDYFTTTSIYEEKVLFLGAIQITQQNKSTDEFNLNPRKPINMNIANKYLFPDRKLESEMKLEYNKDNQITNIHYEMGPPTDPRLSGGDFVMIYAMDNYDNLNILKLESPSYRYRRNLVGDNNSILYNTYLQKLDDFIHIDVSEIYINHPSLNQSMISVTDRINYYTNLFTLSVSPFLQKSVEMYHDRYLNDLHKLANFISQYEYHDNEIVSTILSKTKNIISNQSTYSKIIAILKISPGIYIDNLINVMNSSQALSL